MNVVIKKGGSNGYDFLDYFGGYRVVFYCHL